MIGAKSKFSTFIQQPLLGLQGDTPELYVKIYTSYILASHR